MNSGEVLVVIVFMVLSVLLFGWMIYFEYKSEPKNKAVLKPYAWWETEPIKPPKDAEDAEDGQPKEA